MADWTVAALLDTDERTGRRVAARLAAARLVDVTDAGRETRYGLHDLVRLYARERAEAEDLPAVRQAAVRRALSGWAALADEADRRLPSGALPLGDRLPPGWRPEPAVAERLLERPLGWFERERAALVAAVRQAAGQELELCAGLADSLVDFCATRDYSDDWAAVAGALLDSAEAAGDRRLAGHAERRLAELALYRVDEGAGRHAERAVELTDAAGDGRGAAAARIALGAAYRVLGRPAAGRPALERALAWYEAAGDRHGTGHAVNELGMTDLMLGDEEAGRAHLSSSVRLLRENGDLRGEARALMALGTAESRGADPAAAVAHLRRSMELSRELDDRSLTVISAVLTGRLLVRLGDTDAAMPMLAGALAEAREQHRDSSVGVATLGLGEAHLRRGEPAAARERFRAAREVFVAVGMLAFQGLAEVGLGDVALAEGDPGAARAAWERALPLLDVSAPPRAADLRTRLADLATS